MSYSTPNILTPESQWLAKQLRFQRMLINAVDTNSGGGGTVANTPEQHDLVSTETLTLNANTYKSISFSVIKGSVDVSMDGGDTSINYPLGSNINMNASDTLDMDFVFTVPGTISDGLNRVIIQSISA